MKLHQRESHLVEFKEKLPKDGINKQIIAFANTQGGTIYIGVADDGDVVGIEDVDATCQQITNMARDAIEPDVMMFLDCHIEDIEAKTIIKVAVRNGASKPYYLGNKGPVPAGVFVRQGTSSVQASRPAILKMIQDSNKEVFEELHSPNQNLTFREAGKVFRDKHVHFNENHKVSLGIKNCDGAYTNLGLLLSDQNPHLITMGVFQGTGVNILRDRVDFSGSLLKQLEDTEKFIDFRNATAAEFERLSRIDIRDYPPEAVREVILNLLQHRLYSYPYNTQIKMFSDRIEFTSFGSLPEGMTMERLRSGFSVPRNHKLAEIFLRLKFTEKMGLGIQKIEDGYKDSDVEPVFFADEAIFRVTLPNINEARLASAVTSSYSADKITTGERVSKLDMSLQEQIIVALFTSHQYITRKDVEKELSISKTMASRHLNALVDKGVITSTGSARSTKYYLNKEVVSSRNGS